MSDRPEAFGESYRRNERAMLRYFLAWTRSADLAADLMAETFAEALDSVDRFHPERGEPRAWLFGIAKNVFARSVRRGRVDDAVRQRLGLAYVVVDDHAAREIEALMQDNRLVTEALDGLSPLLREAVAGRVLEEREYGEMAIALECSESVVRQRVKRGLSQLRAQLKDVT